MSFIYILVNKVAMTYPQNVDPRSINAALMRIQVAIVREFSQLACYTDWPIIIIIKIKSNIVTSVLFFELLFERSQEFIQSTQSCLHGNFTLQPQVQLQEYLQNMLILYFYIFQRGFEVLNATFQAFVYFTIVTTIVYLDMYHC